LKEFLKTGDVRLQKVYTGTFDAQARVWQPPPRSLHCCQTHASLPTRTPPFRQIYHNMAIPARLSGLCNLDNYIMT